MKHKSAYDLSRGAPLPAWLYHAIKRKPDRIAITSFEHLTDEELTAALATCTARLDVFEGIANGFARLGPEAESIRAMPAEGRRQARRDCLDVLTKIRSECRKRGR